MTDVMSGGSGDEGDRARERLAHAAANELAVIRLVAEAVGLDPGLQAASRARLANVRAAADRVEDLLWELAAGAGSAAGRGPAPEAEIPSTARPRQVLVVEDDPGLRELVGDALALAGHGVHLAADRLSAVGHPAVATGGLDLLVVDLHLDGDDGREVLAEIRRLVPGVAVLVMTGARPADGDDRIGDGEAWLQKPFRIDELHRAVGRALGD